MENDPPWLRQSIGSPLARQTAARFRLIALISFAAVASVCVFHEATDSGLGAGCVLIAGLTLGLPWVTLLFGLAALAAPWPFIETRLLWLNRASDVPFLMSATLTIASILWFFYGNHY